MSESDDDLVEIASLVTFKETILITCAILFLSVYLFQRHENKHSSYYLFIRSFFAWVLTLIIWFIRLVMELKIPSWLNSWAKKWFASSEGGTTTTTTTIMDSTHHSNTSNHDWTTPLRKVKSSPFITLSYDSQHSQDEDYEGNDPQLNNHHHDESQTPLTDHERFERNYYNHIQSSNYRRLVLPPKCKQIVMDHQRQKQKAATKALNENITLHTKNVLSWFLDIAHGIISFDYIGHSLHFCYRMLSAIQIRVFKHFGYKFEEDDEEEEDDDNTVASNSSRRSLMSKGSTTSTVHITNGTHGKSSSPRPIEGVHQKDINRGLSKYEVVAERKEKGDTNMSQSESHDSLEQLDSKIPLHMTSSQTLLDEEKHSIDINTVTITNSPSTDTTRERFFTSDNDYKKIFPRKLGDPTNDLSFDVSNHSYDDLNLSKSGSWGDGEIDALNHSTISNSQDIPYDESSEQDIASPPRIPMHAVHGSPAYYSSLDMEPNLIPPQSPESSTSDDLPKLGIPKLERTSSKSKKIIPQRPIGKEKDAVKRYRIPIIKPNIISKVSQQEQSDVSPEEMKNSFEPMNFFDTATNERSLKRLGSLAPKADKEGYVLGDEYLEDTRDTPLLVFVNSRSGSQQGLILKMQLRSLLNPIQVWDLADGDPEKVLKSFSVFSRLRLLVCGGDGTVSWIISALDKMKLEKWPPIAILPLGTGNDLARVHGWGSGYANESLLQILNQVQESYVSLLDRWTLTIDPKKRQKKELEKKPFTNYMSIGMDALSALQVHNLRENSPHMFFARAVNKVWYAVFGAEDAIKASYTDLHEQIVLEADGVEVPIPKNSQGLIFLNIDSYLGGVPLWSRGVPVFKTNPRKTRERRYSEGYIRELNNIGLSKTLTKSYDDQDTSCDLDTSFAESLEDKLERIIACDTPSSCQDGRIEVISHSGNFHLGQIRVGLSTAKKVCQCGTVRIKLKKKIAVQIDGEPWMQEKAILHIQREKDPAIMLHRALEEGGGIEMEVANLLEWAEEESYISREAHSVLMKEFSKRIEVKNRDRLTKQGTVFSNMKKRISSTPKLRQS